MPDRELEGEWDRLFAVFEADALPRFRPAPLADVARRAGSLRRRYRYRVLAGLLAALLVPVGVVTAADRGDNRPVPRPTPTVTASPAPTESALPPVVPQPRQQHVPSPDSGLRLRELRFTHDARHAWALFDSCAQDSSGRCRYALETTADAGVSWQRVSVPALPPTGQVLFYPVSPLIAALHARGHGFWVTVDGGRSYTAFPESEPPAAAYAGAEQPYPDGRYALMCPYNGDFEASVNACGPRATVCPTDGGNCLGAPPLTGPLQQVITGADGRVWTISTWHGWSYVSYSVDQAATWIAVPPINTEGVLTASPDGTEVYLVAADPGRVWLIYGRAFVPVPGLPPGLVAPQVVALGGGLLAVREVDGRIWLVGDGRYRPLAGGAQDISRLPDGSLILRRADGSVLVGTGDGLTRDWVVYA